MKLAPTWLRGWDSNPRYLAVSLVFKTSALNHSAISPVCSNQRNYYTTEGMNLSTLIFKLMENEGEESADRQDVQNMLQ